MTDTVDLDLKRNGTFSEVVTWTDDSGAAVDITSYSAKLQLKRNPYDTTAALTLTSGSGLALGGMAGTITITITPAQIATLPLRRYKYDLLLTSGAGAATPLIQGTAYISPGISS